MEQAEYPAMSGSNTICTATVLINEGMVAVTEPITTLMLEAPAGLIRVSAEVRDGKARSITFENVPAFVHRLDVPVEVPQVGTVSVDVAWGGMFYALADASALGFRLTPDEGRDLVRVGEMVKAAAREQVPVAHPEQPELAGISIMEWTGPPSVPGADAKNTVVVSSGTLDWDHPASFTARSIARRAAPAPVPGWRCCTRVASWRSARTSCTRGSGHHLDRPAAAPDGHWSIPGRGAAADRIGLDHRTHRILHR